MWTDGDEAIISQELLGVLSQLGKNVIFSWEFTNISKFRLHMENKGLQLKMKIFEPKEKVKKEPKYEYLQIFCKHASANKSWILNLQIEI